MTLEQPVGRIRTLQCDHPGGCDWTFNTGHWQDRLAAVRGQARQHGWLCDNPGPGKPARDLCPRHREGREVWPQ